MKLKENIYNVLFESIQEGLIVLDDKGYMVQSNSTSEKMFGYEKSSLLGERIELIVPSDSRKEHVKDRTSYHKDSAQRFMGSTKVLKGQRRDGSFFPVEVSLNPFKNDDGKQFTIALVSDVTIKRESQEKLEKTTQSLKNQIKKVEEKTSELRQSEEAFRGNFENAAIGMALLHVNGNWFKVNSKICEILGYPENELKKLRLQDITHPEDYNKYLTLQLEMIQGERDYFQMEKRYYHKAGHIIYVLLAVSMVKDEEGKILYYVSQIIDISKRIDTELKLKSLLAENEAILDATTEIILVSTDKNGIITNNNVGAERLLGFEEKEIIGKNIRGLLFTESKLKKVALALLGSQIEKEEDSKVLKALTAQKEHIYREWKLKRKNNKSFTAIVSVSEIITNHKTKGYLFAATDISYIKKIQSQLEQQNEELEQFAHIAAHDLKEPLRGITTYLSVLQKKYRENLSEEANSYIENAFSNAKRMKKLISNILDFSKTGSIDREEVDLNKLVDSIFSNYEQDEKISTVNLRKSKLPTLKGDPVSFIQLFTNLIDNAIKYQSKGNQAEVNIYAKESKSSWTISVADNGIGIDPDQKDKVFEIFKRLHSQYEYSGTGIGLATCKKIISAFGGKIWFKPNKPHGTVFIFRIPKK